MLDSINYDIFMMIMTVCSLLIHETPSPSPQSMTVIYSVHLLYQLRWNENEIALILTRPKSNNMDTVVIIVDVPNGEMFSSVLFKDVCRCPGIQASAPFMDACILG